MATYQQLLAQKAALEAELREMRATEINGVIDRIRTLMAEYGLSLDDIQVKRRRGRPPRSQGAENTAKTNKQTLPPKYRDPKTGKTWSGRGRAPGWLGTNPKKYLIADEIGS